MTINKYFVMLGGSRAGPIAVDELASRRVDTNTLVWCIGMPEWAPASAVGELAGRVADGPLLPPPSAPPTPIDSAPAPQSRSSEAWTSGFSIGLAVTGVIYVVGFPFGWGLLGYLSVINMPRSLERVDGVLQLLLMIALLSARWADNSMRRGFFAGVTVGVVALLTLSVWLSQF